MSDNTSKLQRTPTSHPGKQMFGRLSNTIRRSRDSSPHGRRVTGNVSSLQPDDEEEDEEEDDDKHVK